MSFSELRFNNDLILYNTRGGTSYQTKITQTNGGREQRNATWQQSRASWELNDQNVTESRLDYMLDFIHAMRGMEGDFRMKDWGDYRTKGRGILNLAGAGNATNQAQLYKRYAAGSRTSEKKIVRPIEATVELFMDGAPLAAILDSETGVVTIEDITRVATGAVAVGTSSYTLTVPAHGFQAGDVIGVALAGGTWATLNGQRVIASVDADHINILGNASGLGTFTGGTLVWYPQARNVLTWEGEFDLPARFDQDDLVYEFIGADVESEGVLGEKYFSVSGLRIVEVKY